MSNLTTLPKGDSAWLLRKSIQRIMQQVSVLETNIGSSTTGNSSNTQVIFNDNGTLRGDAGLTYNAATDTLTAGSATITGDLTVDTSTLKVDSANNRVGILTASPAAALHVNNGNIRLNDGYQLEFGGGFNSISGSNASNYLLFYINNSEAMRLNSTGLGVGVSPTQPLTVRSSAAAIGMFHSTNVNGPYVIFQNSTANFGDIGSELAITGGGSAGNMTLNSRLSSNLCFAVSDSVKMRIDSSGNVGIGVTPSAGKGCLQLSSGINFPATQVASSDANTLDDYEEGTFTPTVVGSSTVGSATYATQIGRYVKIGRQVTAWVHLEWSGGTGTGNLRFGGLPFNIVTLGSNNFPSASIGYISNIALSANNIAVAYGQNAENNVNLGQYPVGGGTGASVAYDTAGQIIFTITYEV